MIYIFKAQYRYRYQTTTSVGPGQFFSLKDWIIWISKFQSSRRTILLSLLYQDAPCRQLSEEQGRALFKRKFPILLFSLALAYRY